MTVNQKMSSGAKPLGCPLYEFRVVRCVHKTRNFEQKHSIENIWRESDLTKVAFSEGPGVELLDPWLVEALLERYDVQITVLAEARNVLTHRLGSRIRKLCAYQRGVPREDTHLRENPGCGGLACRGFGGPRHIVCGNVCYRHLSSHTGPGAAINSPQPAARQPQGEELSP